MSAKAVVLLSGGIDSTTCLAIARDQGFDVYALTVRYGQRHEVELEAAKKIARYFNARQHLIIDVDLTVIGGSALTANVEVPTGRDITNLPQEIPATYVPARNIIFLSLALAWAEVLGATDIFIGANVMDYSGYPDCRPEFLTAFEQMAKLGTKAGIEGRQFTIHAPLIHWTKARIIQTGVKLGVDYAMTHSCYNPSPNGNACGQCDSCLWRKKGFAEAGILDPTLYQS